MTRSKANFDQADGLCGMAARDARTVLVNSVTLTDGGQKTAAFEIVDELATPDVHCIRSETPEHHPILARLRRDHAADGRHTAPHARLGRPPGRRRWCRRAGGFPETIATAIRIGNPASWDGAIAAADDPAAPSAP